MSGLIYDADVWWKLVYIERQDFNQAFNVLGDTVLADFDRVIHAAEHGNKLAQECIAEYKYRLVFNRLTGEFL